MATVGHLPRDSETVLPTVESQTWLRLRNCSQLSYTGFLVPLSCGPCPGDQPAWVYTYQSSLLPPPCLTNVCFPLSTISPIFFFGEMAFDWHLWGFGGLWVSHILTSNPTPEYCAPKKWKHSRRKACTLMSVATLWLLKKRGGGSK